MSTVFVLYAVPFFRNTVPRANLNFFVYWYPLSGSRSGGLVVVLQFTKHFPTLNSRKLFNGGIDCNFLKKVGFNTEDR